MRTIQTITSFILLFTISITQAQIGEWTSIEESSSWMNKNLQNIRQDSKTFEQDIQVDKEKHNYTALTIKETDAKGGITSHLFDFYLGHLDKSKTTFEIKGTEINVILSTKDGLKLIKTSKDGSFQAYKNKIEIKCDDPQLAKDVIDAMNYTIHQSTYSIKEVTDKESAIHWLTKNIQNVNFTTVKVEQDLQYLVDQRNKLVLNVTETNDKGKTDMEFTFYANDFNGSKGELNVKGESLVMKFVTQDNLNMVKIYKNGEQQKFNKYFELYADDAKIALDILDVFQVAFGKSNVVPTTKTNSPDATPDVTPSSGTSCTVTGSKKEVNISLVTNHDTADDAASEIKRILMSNKFITEGSIQNGNFSAKRTTNSRADYYVADVTTKKEGEFINGTIVLIKIGTGTLKLLGVAEDICEALK